MHHSLLAACFAAGVVNSRHAVSCNPVLAAIGFNVETVTYKNIKFQARPRRSWLRLAATLLALAYVCVYTPTRLFPCGLSQTYCAGVGPGRADEHPAVLAVLLPQHAGHHLRGRQQRHRAHRHLRRGVPRHPGRGGAQGRAHPRVRQQTGAAPPSAESLVILVYSVSCSC